ncbi:MAG: molybdopterin-dependent oxidoreductase [Nitrospirae bacterium]|nr:molybdopterin-dependent oxidoreductase [Nitrospirota bacterium]
MAVRHKRYGMLINLDRCIGCYACQATCKAEYAIPFGTFRCRVETYRSGRFPLPGKFFVPRLCNHCDIAPCIEQCREKALFKNRDGVVEIDPGSCVGCGACSEKCPYHAIDLNNVAGKAEKCDFCYARITKGLSPVCVQSCMGKAILFGDINDPASRISTEMARHRLKVLNPDFGTNPSVFYTFRGDTGDAPLKNLFLTEGPPTRRVMAGRPGEQAAGSAKLVHTSDSMCPSECGISVLVEDGIAKKIYGNPHTLINNGAFCAKGASGLQLTYSPDRIKTPLIRTGQRGEDAWKEITWEEACDYIAGKLVEVKERYGPESVFLDCGDVTDREAYYRLFYAYGTPNTYNHGSICDPNRRWGQGIMLGDERPLPDVQRPVLMRNDDNELYLKETHDARLILNIGANPFVATRFNYMSAGIVAAREENRCAYIVVDPAYTNSAARADMWSPIIPGTDAALLAGMLYNIIRGDPEHGYMDHNFLNNYTTGWMEFREAFLAYSEDIDPSNNLSYFSAEWAEEKTGIPGDDIKKMAHLFGSTKPASIEIGMHGTAHHANGDVTSILMSALCLVTGNIDVPGGTVFAGSTRPERGGKTSGKEFLRKTVRRTIDCSDVLGRISELRKDLYGDFPAAWKGVLTDLPKKIREGITLKHGTFKGHSYPVKAFITRAGNPVMTAGSTPDWIDALTLKKKKNPPLPPFAKGGDALNPPLKKGDEGGLLNEYELELIVFIDTHITETGKYADIILPEAGYLERMGVSDVYTMSPEIALRDQVIKPLYDSKTPYEIMIALSGALIKAGDPDVRAEDFVRKYRDEEDFINEILADAPGLYNVGVPLPYPDLPEGCLVLGAPDNPTAVWGKLIIRHGDPVTVDWLRRHHGVAIWPASYYRYKKANNLSSGIYPKTASGKFEFRFSYLEGINRKLGTNFPVTFYWRDFKREKNSLHKGADEEYPFRMITGRAHHSMTMTTVCQYLSETETECMQKMNDEFSYAGTCFNAQTVSIPVIAMNIKDGERMGIKTGDLVVLETPLKNQTRGKAFLTEEIMPGVIKTAFGPGGQKASGRGFINSVSEYTPNINECFDPGNISPFTGMPGFGDIMVKVIEVTGSGEGQGAGVKYPHLSLP